MTEVTRTIRIGSSNGLHARPAKLFAQAAKESGRAIDATQGRKTKAVLITDGEMLVLSALQPETIAKRFGIFSENEAKGEYDG